MYQVLDNYQRFNQKNNMIFRIHWDSSQAHLDALRVETQLNTPSLNPVLMKADDLAGYGRYLNPQWFWGSG